VSRRFDANGALELARALSFPRQTGSPGGRRARTLIREAFAAIDLPVEEQRFRFSTRPWRVLRGLFVFSAITLSASVLAAALGAAAAAVFLSVAPVLAWIGARASRSSILSSALTQDGDRCGCNLVSAPVGDGRLDVLLVAHYDSKSQAVPLPVRMLGIAAFGVCCVGAAAGYTFGLLAADALPAWAMALAALGAACALVSGALRPGNASPGALDNASGVAVLITIARAVREAPIPGVRVRFLLTDAEEYGTVGAVAFVERHKDKIPSPVLNLDTVGAGRRIWLYGPRHGGRTRSALEEAAIERGLPLIGPRSAPGVLADHIPFGTAGWDAITVARLSRGVLRIHTPRDAAEMLEPAALRETGNLVLTALDRMVRTAG